MDTPTRGFSDIFFAVPIGASNGLPVFENLSGNPHLQSERVKAYEIGYRIQPRQTLSFDLALYFNNYTNLIVTSPPSLVVTGSAIFENTEYVNTGHAQTRGAELSAQWRPLQRWRLSTSASEIRGGDIAVQGTPRYLFSASSQLDLPHGLELNSALYHDNALPPQGQITGGIEVVPTFNRVDVGISWHFLPQCTLAVDGRNL